MVLKGAKALLASESIEIIQFEFNKMNVFSRTFMHDFFVLLPKFRFFRMVQDGLVALGEYNPGSWELFGYQNIVCFRGDPDLG